MRAAVDTIATVFFNHRDFLRAVIIISATNETVRSRGVDASNALAAIFDNLTDAVTPPELRTTRAAVFQMLFGGLVLRTGFGADFATPDPVSDEVFVEGMKRIAEAA